MSAGTPEELAEKIGKAVTAFERRGVTLEQLETKLGKPRARWLGREYARLDVLFGSIKRNEITVDEAFEPARVTRDEIVGTPPAEPAEDPTRPDLHLFDEHQTARALATIGQQYVPGKAESQPITEFCGYATPDGPCDLPAGHPTGPEYDGFDGHDVVSR
jgi:hypothetical protein